MDLLLTFLLFIVCMTVSLACGVSMLVPLSVGFVLFTLLAVRRGFRLRQVLGFAVKSLKESLIVIFILLLIGCLTGMWRLSGTVAYFVTLGVSAIPARFFLPACFLLSSAMSYALGTSFGVTATAGVILMSIAEAGGVNPVLAAGAILSGVYVGDRGSPAASSANLVAVLTHTDMRGNVRAMLSTSLVPFFACCVLYVLLSFAAPMETIDTALLEEMAAEFHLSGCCLIPALLMIALPFCKVSVKGSMAISLLASALVAIFVQHGSFSDCLNAMVMGYSTHNTALSGMLSGGGMVSMAEVCFILLISCSYGSIFEGTKLLTDVNEKTKRISDRIGRTPAMMLLSLAVLLVFCNQTIGAIMQSHLSRSLYGDSEGERTAKMLDMENSVIPLAGMIPWCIACSVPLTMLNADARSLPLAFFLWLLPLWWLFLSRKHETSQEGKSRI